MRKQHLLTLCCVVDQPSGPFRFRQPFVHFLFYPFGDQFKNQEADEERHRPFHKMKAVFVDHGFFGGKAPKIPDAAGGEEMRYQSRGSHTNSKANEITGHAAVEVRYKLPGYLCHRRLTNRARQNCFGKRQ